MATSKTVPTPRRVVNDEETEAIIYAGANVTQLAEMFKITPATVKSKVMNLKPAGVRNKVNIYRIHEVAPHLVKPKGDFEEVIKRMHYTELPLMLRKEFWAAQKAKQSYELEAGELWSTTRIITEVGELMKLVKMSVQLMSDTVERQVELTDRQRQIIKQMSDSMLEDLRRKVEEKFQPPDRTTLEMTRIERDDDPL